MKYLILTVRDRAAAAFGTPMYHMSRGSAIRGFADEVNRCAEHNMLFHHPEDFDLFELGTFDDSSGLFATGAPEQVCVGKDVAVREARSQLSLPLNGGDAYAS